MVLSFVRTGANERFKLKILAVFDVTPVEVSMKRFFRGMFYNLTIFRDLMTFLWKEKLWFLIPVVALLMLFGLLLIFGTASGISPVIYALF